MTGKISVEIGDVQKTLFLPLWGRAVETQKKHPLLVDTTAVRIMNNVNLDFTPLTTKMSPLSQYTWILRSRHVDKVIKEFLEQFPRGTIVNIGCGLDTTFERVDNGSLRWYDLDLPDVINLRRQFIPESDRRTYLASSFLEPNWLQSIPAAKGLLFVAAGVFYYFKETEIKEFLLRLKGEFPGSQILFDASSEFGVKTANKMVIQRGGLDEKSYLVWGLDKPEDLEKWDAEIRILNVHYYFRENRKILPLKIFLIGTFSDSKRIQYMVQLKLGGD